MACATHAIICASCANHIESDGKKPINRSGKFPVNENDEKNTDEISLTRIVSGHLYRRAFPKRKVGCPGTQDTSASLPAVVSLVTSAPAASAWRSAHAWLATALPRAAWAAARRAIGTR